MEVRNNSIEERVESMKRQLIDTISSINESNSYSTLNILFKLRNSLNNIFYNKEKVADRNTSVVTIIAKSKLSKDLAFAADNIEDVVSTLTSNALSFSQNLDFESGQKAYSELIQVSKKLEKTSEDLAKEIIHQIEEGNASPFVLNKYYTGIANDNKDKIFAEYQNGKTYDEIAEEYHLRRNDIIRDIVSEQSKLYMSEHIEEFKNDLSKDVSVEDIANKHKLNITRLQHFLTNNNLLTKTNAATKVKTSETTSEEPASTTSSKKKSTAKTDDPTQSQKQE